LSVAKGLGRHEPGTRICSIQANKPIVTGSGRFAEYGAVVGAIRQYQ